MFVFVVFRAAAYTQVGNYEAAIDDSNEAIRLDPNYSKAYSRLGLAYYTQGKYKEAIEKGFQIGAHLFYMCTAEYPCLQKMGTPAHINNLN